MKISGEGGRRKFTAETSVVGGGLETKLGIFLQGVEPNLGCGKLSLHVYLLLQQTRKSQKEKFIHLLQYYT